MKQIIGLTGPTGAGKSEAARALAAAGCAIIDADRISRQVVADPECLAELAEAFGADILFPDGTLNRRELARRAFVSPEQQSKLNRITHPRILIQMGVDMHLALKNGARAAVVDAPLLLESGVDVMCGAVAVVLAPPEVRLARICARDGISEADARLRMEIQPKDAFYRERADVVFCNDGAPEALRQDVVRWLEAYLSQEEVHET